MTSFLGNPAVVGFVANPTSQATAPSQGRSPAGGFFAIYDITGKTDVIQMLMAAGQAAGAPAPTQYGFSGTSIEVRTANSGAIYSARTGGYFLVANQRRTIEDLITRFQGAGLPAASLGQLPEYQAIVKYLGSDTSLDFFGRVPDFIKWIPPGEKYAPLVHFLEGLHLEAVHAAGEGISFSGEATRLRGAILGDASPGSLFDIVGPSSATFLTQPVMGAAPAFRISRVDFAAAYRIVFRAISEALTPQQMASVAAMEGMAQNYLGMSIDDALALFSGEIAEASSYSDDGTPQSLVALTIEKPDDVLRILRAVVGKMTVAEDTSGNTTYLDLMFPYKDPATGAQRRMFYFVAVTPQMLLAAPRKAMLQAAVEQLDSPSGGASPGGIFADPEYIQMRSLLPENLSGLTGAEIDRIPWDKLAAKLENQREQTRKQSNSRAPDFSWLSSIKFEVISRHLHWNVGGWWKDSTGIYSDSYIQ
ncbi:MAG: hypothetical protein ACLQMT_07485 [Candidatus Acidiferrales bacterium]